MKSKLVQSLDIAGYTVLAVTVSEDDMVTFTIQDKEGVDMFGEVEAAQLLSAYWHGWASGTQERLDSPL